MIKIFLTELTISLLLAEFSYANLAVKFPDVNILNS